MGVRTTGQGRAAPTTVAAPFVRAASHLFRLGAFKHSWFHLRPGKCWGADLHFPAEATKARKNMVCNIGRS